jgi:hypothetical protein
MGSLGNTPLCTEAFAMVVELLGVTPLSWLRYAGECPRCIDPVAGFTPDLGCPLCEGTGALYTAMEIPAGGKLVLAGVRIGKTKAPIEILAGDLNCSFLPDAWPLEARDRIVLPDRELRFTETLTRGGGASDRLTHGPAVAVQSVYASAGLVAASHYALGSDKRSITWSGGPAAGSLYTVAYTFRPSYYVAEDSIHHRPAADDGSRFPSACIMRLWGQSPFDSKQGEN